MKSKIETTHKAWLKHGYLQDNTPKLDEQVECIVDELDWQKQGLSYTSTGYGSKIPTQYKIKWHGRWYRVYCRVYSNIGTLYIISKGERIVVDIEKV